MVAVQSRTKALISTPALLSVAASSAQDPVAPGASRKPVTFPSTTPTGILRVDVPLVMIPAQVRLLRSSELA